MFTIDLNERELNIVAAGLGKLPYETVAPVIESISKQVKAQTAAKVTVDEAA